MNKPADDLDAVRIITSALEGFDSKDREMIIRWSLERLGMVTSSLEKPQNPTQTITPTSDPQTLHPPNIIENEVKDIRSFSGDKKPTSDVQFAVVATFYYHFKAKPEEQKSSINKDQLIEACRHADWKILPNPKATLDNAVSKGYMDRAGDGQFRLNSVGENLVRKVLPGAPERASAKSKKRASVKNTKKSKTG